jgi:hypothetical protein
VSPLVSLCRIFLSEEVWGRESSRVRFSSNPKFRFFLKSKCEFFSLFFCFDLTVALPCLPWCPCAEYFCLGLGRESRS